MAHAPVGNRGHIALMLSPFVRFSINRKLLMMWLASRRRCTAYIPHLHRKVLRRSKSISTGLIMKEIKVGLQQRRDGNTGILSAPDCLVLQRIGTGIWKQYSRSAISAVKLSVPGQLLLIKVLPLLRCRGHPGPAWKRTLPVVIKIQAMDGSPNRINLGTDLCISSFSTYTFKKIIVTISSFLSTFWLFGTVA